MRRLLVIFLLILGFLDASIPFVAHAATIGQHTDREICTSEHSVAGPLAAPFPDEVYSSPLSDYGDQGEINLPRALPTASASPPSPGFPAPIHYLSITLAVPTPPIIATTC